MTDAKQVFRKWNLKKTKTNYVFFGEKNVHSLTVSSFFGCSDKLGIVSQLLLLYCHSEGTRKKIG